LIKKKYRKYFLELQILLLMLIISIFCLLSSRINRNTVKYKRLIDAAKKAKVNSFSPHSKFRVGAAIVTQSGKIFSGCNIENSSYSLTMCAERTAIFKAMSEGNRKFKAIAISSDLKKEIPPCGACRQVLFDLAGDIDVIMLGEKGSMRICKLHDLLPIPFDSSMITNK